MTTNQNNCCVCQKSLFNFQEEYVDETYRPKYYLDDKIFCSPVCSNDYYVNFIKEKKDERT